jgi:branched-chain amino acid transport system substrate-binding protein
MPMRPSRRALWAMQALAPFSYVFGAGSAAAYELVVPALEYRTGPYAPSGIPLWTGFIDYLTLLNERDGGIRGVRIKIPICETAYDTQRGVECYERIKGEALVIVPGSTPITYALIPKTPVDRVPIVSTGYGRTSSADGRVFPWVFNFPATYWSAASIIVKYIADRERGEKNLKGKKIGLFYLNSAYGREPIPILIELAKAKGFEFLRYPIEPPGQDQDQIWVQIERDRPDWILLWGYGVMNQVAVAKAAEAGFPMGNFIGNWWAGAENDVQLAGSGADGYLAAALQAPGAVCPVHEDIFRYVYDTGKAAAADFKSRVGEVLYNRGLAQAMWITEGIAKAMDLHGKRELSAVDVRDGLEALDITAERLEALGFEGMLAPMKLTCANHEGSGRAAIQQWDGVGRRWRLVSGFYEPDRELIEPLLTADAKRFAQENKIQVRECR